MTNRLGRRLTHDAHIGLAADGQEMLGERRLLAVWVEDILAGLQESADPVEIEKKLELANRVVPCSSVVATNERRERGKRFYLDVVFPPGRAEDQGGSGHAGGSRRPTAGPTRSTAPQVRAPASRGASQFLDGARS